MSLAERITFMKVLDRKKSVLPKVFPSEGAHGV